MCEERTRKSAETKHGQSSALFLIFGSFAQRDFRRGSCLGLWSLRAEIVVSSSQFTMTVPIRPSRNLPRRSVDSIDTHQYMLVDTSRSRLAGLLAELAQRCQSQNFLRCAAGLYRWAIAVVPAKAPTPSASAIGCAYGAVLMQLEHWETALQAYTQVTKLDRNHPEAWFRTAGLLAHLQGHEAASDSYLEAVRCDPTRQWFYHSLLWEVLTTTDQLPRLEADLRALLDQRGAIMRYQERADIRLNLGEVLTRQGQIAAAAAVYRQAMYDRLVQHDRRFLDELWHPTGDRHPDFIILGAQKCGTTSLFYYLMQHPHVLPSLRKEVNFWSSYVDYGLEWYQSQLAPHPASGRWLTGESSPSYFTSPQAPERLVAALPQSKLIALLRNPVDRVVSHFYHQQRQNKEFRSLETAVDDLLFTFAHHPEAPTVNPLTAGFYAQHLRRWLQWVNPDRLLILQAETFFHQPDSIMADVQTFLGLPQISLDAYRPYNAGSYPAAETRVRAKLADFFAPYNRDLETLLDRRFGW